MRKITLLFSLLFVQFVFAQFTQNEVKYWIGEGSKSVVFIADFKTDYTPNSYAWGYHFDGDNVTFEDLINDVATTVNGVSHNTNGGFLSQFDYYHHTPVDNYWSTWSGESFETLQTNFGISEVLEDGSFYAISFGFGPAPDYEAYAPNEPIAAYDANWFISTNISEWSGEGDKQTIVVVDFGTDSEGIADSYAFGVQFSEEEISANTVLDIISSHFEDFDYEITENQIGTLSFNGHSGVTSQISNWNLYKGQDLASWYEVENTSANITNLDWFGLSFGDRMPFTPQDAVLDTNEFKSAQIVVYPNPTTERLFISSNAVQQITIYDITGKKIKSERYTSNGIDVSALENGTYLIQIEINNTIKTHRFIKR